MWDKSILASILLTCPLVMLKVPARLDLNKISADFALMLQEVPSVRTRTSEHPAIYIEGCPTDPVISQQRSMQWYNVIYTIWRLMWSWSWNFPIQINESLKNFRHCKTHLRIICEQFPGMAWLDAKTGHAKRLQKPPEIRSIAHSKETSREMWKTGLNDL